MAQQPKKKKNETKIARARNATNNKTQQTRHSPSWSGSWTKDDPIPLIPRVVVEHAIGGEGERAALPRVARVCGIAAVRPNGVCVEVTAVLQHVVVEAAVCKRVVVPRDADVVIVAVVAAPTPSRAVGFWREIHQEAGHTLGGGGDGGGEGGVGGGDGGHTLQDRYTYSAC